MHPFLAFSKIASIMPCKGNRRKFSQIHAYLSLHGVVRNEGEFLLKPPTTFKRISSKNADYGAAEQYLTFEHDEFPMKPTLDKNGQIVPRTGHRISSLNCDDEDFAIACMRSNLKCHRKPLYQIDLLHGKISNSPSTYLSRVMKNMCMMSLTWGLSSIC